MKHFDIRIYGLVQGINFRQNTLHKAQKLKLTGFVQNLPDGSVLIQAEGSLVALEELLAWCRKGPWFAKVERVAVAEGQILGYNKFEIK